MTLPDFPIKPLTYIQEVNDVFVAWLNTEEKLNQLQSELKEHLTSIQCIIEKENNQLPYFDIQYVL